MRGELPANSTCQSGMVLSKNWSYRAEDMTRFFFVYTVIMETHHPITYTGWLTAANRAVAPAGGCVVSVICMRTVANEAERDPASQRRSSRRCELCSSPKSFVIHTPTRAEIKCPPMRARG